MRSGASVSIEDPPFLRVCKSLREEMAGINDGEYIELDFVVVCMRNMILAGPRVLRDYLTRVFRNCSIAHDLADRRLERWYKRNAVDLSDLFLTACA